MKAIQEIIVELEKLVRNDNKETRSKIAQLCHKLLNEDFKDYLSAPTEFNVLLTTWVLWMKLKVEKNPKFCI